MDLLQPSTATPSLWPERRNRGYKFESDTDTDTVAILAKYSQPDKRITFTTLIKTILKELEGSFAFVFKSTDKKLKVDFVDVEFAGAEADTKAVESLVLPTSPTSRLAPPSLGPKISCRRSRNFMSEDGVPQPIEFFIASDAAAMLSIVVPPTSPTSRLAPPSLGPKISRRRSRNFMSEDGVPQPIEFFIASDAAAIVEYTKRVLYLEDDDIAHIAEGQLHIHRLRATSQASPTLLPLVASRPWNFAHGLANRSVASWTPPLQ
ncbi:hypothetical protein BU15DRAFT_78601 [Melanogaster broomeanus]|nr:hypothetical protein BU15DRAFT_78601 [Melanogaster broomeanus]